MIRSLVSLRGRSVLTFALLALMPMAAAAQDADTNAGAEPANATEPTEEGWSWVAAPYLWATSVTTNLREDAPPVGSETEFSDIISKIDMALLMHVEGQGEQFGAFGDLVYLSLGDEATHANSTTESSLDVSITEIAGVWNVEPARYEGLDVFAGVRHFATSLDVRIDPTNPVLPTVDVNLDQNFTDFMVGARYNAMLSDRWGMSLRLDLSTGDTEGTLNASALLRYKVGKGAWLFGYRYMDVELDAKGKNLDLTLSGPLIAYSFGF